MTPEVIGAGAKTLVSTRSTVGPHGIPRTSLMSPLAPAQPPVISLDERRRRAEIDALIREHRQVLDVMAVKLCRSTLDPADLVQDVLERFVAAYDQIPPEVPVRAWLLRVMHNRFIDLVRRVQHAAPVEPEELVAPEVELEPWWLQLSSEDVHARLGALPDELREAFRLFTVEGLAYQDIAARLGISRNTVGTRILRARRRLRSMFSGGADE
jgi:RNA polymerase sigma-70 factor, ECF subfamily